ncbi:MAG: glycogen synthase GlgA [Variovorax sp.]
MRILQVSAEFFPLLKTGGLADVAGALPWALRDAGADVRVLLPGFPSILAGVRTRGDRPDSVAFAAGPTSTSLLGHTPWGDPVHVIRGWIENPGPPDATPLVAYVIDAPTLYDRPGSPYEDAEHRPYDDNARRFALLGWVAAQLAQGLDPAWRPEVVHAHDWHAGLAPAYMALGPSDGQPSAASVFTVHNLAYQGVFAYERFPELGLPGSAYQMHGVEFHGGWSFMKAGLFYADRLTTVSPSYAREIQTPAQGHGLDGLLASRGGDLTGILNGVDETTWDPAHDAFLPTPFNAQKPAGKALCKATMQAELGLAQAPEAPLFIVVSRLSEQKGLPLVLQGLDALQAKGAQLALLGSGESWLEQAFSERARAAPRSVSATIGYDEARAHRLFGAGDVTLVPSLFEPCGLTQLYGLKYGSLPVVRSVGGLADSVVDASPQALADGSASGFVFSRFALEDYLEAIDRAVALFLNAPSWQQVRAQAMRRRFCWAEAATKYMAVYRSLLGPIRASAA